MAVEVPPGPGADHALDEVAHGEQKQQDQNPREFARHPADVVIKGVPVELAAAADGAAVALRTAAVVLPALNAVSHRLTDVDQSHNQKSKRRRCII